MGADEVLKELAPVYRNVRLRQVAPDDPNVAAATDSYLIWMGAPGAEPPPDWTRGRRTELVRARSWAWNRDLWIAWPRDAHWRVTPAVDVAESDKDFELTAELPGMSEKDVELTLANGNLVIKGEKKEQREARETDYYLSERRYGAFVRAFELPPGVDASKIEASFAKGVLTIKLPKTAEAQKTETKIPVKAA